MIVIFDSTVLIEDFHLQSPNLRLFRWHIENTKTELVVPEIVVQEVKNKYREKGRSVYDSYTSKVRELDTHFYLSVDYSRKSINLEEHFKNYDKELDNNLKLFAAKIPSYSKIPHNVLVERDLERKRPFRKIGKKQDSTGYRDSLIWETILRQIAPDADKIVLITNNKSDFWDTNSGTLHDDLVQDLKNKSLDQNLIQVCLDIEDFNKTFVIPKIPKVEKAKIELEHGKYKDFTIEEWFEKNIPYIMDKLQDEIHIPLEEFFFEIVSSKITWIDFHEFSVNEVLKLDSKTILIDLNIDATFSIDTDVISLGQIEDLYDLPIDMDIHIHDRNYASLTVWIKLPTYVQLLFDIDKKEVETFETNIHEIFGLCYKCGEPFLNDALEKCPKCNG